jgi:hypothetical protein
MVKGKHVRESQTTADSLCFSITNDTCFFRTLFNFIEAKMENISSTLYGCVKNTRINIHITNLFDNSFFHFIAAWIVGVRGQVGEGEFNKTVTPTTTPDKFTLKMIKKAFC